MISSGGLAVNPHLHRMKSSGGSNDRSDGNNDEGKPEMTMSSNFHVKTRRRSTTVSVQQSPVAIQQFDASSVICGLIAGVFQAGVFSPYDRALYLSVKDRTEFLSYSNWSRPFSGLSQSIGGRALSGGIFFPLEHACMSYMSEGEKNPYRNFLAGTMAGALNAIMLNPLSALKYKTWGREESRGVLQEASSMVRKSGGLRPFFNGLTPTVLRDVTFGGCYTFLRLQAQCALDLPPEHQWIGNFFAAAAATVVSGPFNLARNEQYSTKSRERAPSTWQVLSQFAYETTQFERPQERLQYIQQRLRIGWGTARVAMGMAFGHYLYDLLHHMIRLQGKH